MKPLGAIKEVKTTLGGQRQEFACALLDRSPSHVVVYYPVGTRRRVGSLLLPRGTQSFGYFWRDRPYTVYHWLTPEGRTLGFYVNLADQVEFRPGEVRWRDLAVDLLFNADGSRVQVLDEEETAGLPPDLRAKIDALRNHVLTHRDDLLAEVRGATEHLRRRGRRGGALRGRQ
ncbi:MAG: DUF402 domain-containing protein [Armatimonadota bacterium]|nr:DUF402 domain-containing protein [Armatimonadota bacterium]MDR7451802.1 DUF402 domain-containing protein [Armatimonadota bacterium]MDR7467427.1 DUF402 domain-containing protein [Armatimonadota bacterium]MDR7494197.1 DUF402 domain-containing protein [Armatimonadota bacterium]MDR7498837.1 DUF402 domain-containing protein [Armatimonadota bacterium]